MFPRAGIRFTCECGGKMVTPSFPSGSGRAYNDWKAPRAVSSSRYGGHAPENFNIENDGKLRYLWPTFNADPDDFSPSELAAMEKAWNLLIPMMDKGYAGYLERWSTFTAIRHSLATRTTWHALMDAVKWTGTEIIDCYDRLNGTDHWRKCCYSCDL